MSGGFFEYQDYRMEDIAKLLRLEIAKCRQKPDWVDDYRKSYPEAFLSEMSKAYNMLVETQARLHRLDWVFSGDDGVECYFRRLPEDMNELEFDDPAKDDGLLAEEKERVDEENKEYGRYDAYLDEWNRASDNAKGGST